MKRACAGTMESSDVYVELEPSAEGISIQLESAVEFQFGDAIRAAAMDVLRQYGIEKAAIRLVDHGALDCVIRARVETAVMRGMEE